MKDVHKIAYLVSEHPAVSHTFILREINTLRTMGFEIPVVSINQPTFVLKKIEKAEQSEIEKTFYVKKNGSIKGMKAFLQACMTHPIGTIKGLTFSFWSAGWDIKKQLFHLFYFVEALIVGVWMKQIKVSHLHVHFANPACTVALIASKIFPLTFSVTVHGPDEFDHPRQNLLTEKIEGAKFLCCIGYYARSQLMKNSFWQQWTKFEIVHQGVNPEIYTPQVFRPNPSPFHLLNIGRLVSAKGHRILLSALEMLLSQKRHLILNLVGDGPEHDRLHQEVIKRKLDKYVKFLGSLNQSEVLEQYRQADLFILTSFAEGIPITLMEAMSMEIPCISTYVNGIPELITHQVNGILINPSDVEGTAEAIAWLIDHPQERERLGKAGRIKIQKEFNLENNVKKLADIYIKWIKENYL